MKTITLLNEKGGVGKTTTATHLAAGLAVRGHRVLIIDTDPQGHATVLLGNKKMPAFYDLIVRDADFSDVMRIINPEVYELPGQPVKGKLYLIPSNIETRNISNSIDEAFAIKWKLAEASEIVDFIIIDTSPTPSLLHASIYMATDAIIYPVTPEYLSFDGFAHSVQHRRSSDKLRQQEGMKIVQMMGIVPTMVRPHTTEHTENLNDMRAEYGDKVWPDVMLRTIWGQASRLHRLVWTLKPDGEAAAEAWALVDCFEREVVNV
jgi:chromosome partitioning protein